MRTGKEIKSANDWKRVALESTKEKLPLWAMLGIYSRALDVVEDFGNDEMQALATKTKEDVRAVMVRYDLQELLRLMAEQHAFKIDERDKFTPEERAED